MASIFFVFGDGEEAPETHVGGEIDEPNVGDVVRFYVKAWHGREDVEDACEHMTTDGVPYKVRSVSRSYARNYNGDWRSETIVKLDPHIG